MPWAAMAVAMAAATALQFTTPDLVGIDSYFHIRYAQVIREAGVRGFPPAFPWLPLTILAPDRYADHHLLYHVLLVPFTVGDPRLGGKIAALAGIAALLGALVWFLRRQGVSQIGIVLLALGAASADFLFRVSMTRVQALSLVCLLVGLNFALEHRHRALVVLGCVYAWLYDGFPLLMLPVGATLVAEIVCARRLRPGIAIAALGGMAIGLVVNPYFPEYLRFMVHHFGDKLVSDAMIRVGGEWRPYAPLNLLGNALPAMLLVAFGVATLGWNGLRGDRRALAALVVAGVFFALTLRSQRFIEYFAPTATVFAALAGAAVVSRMTTRGRRALVVLLTVVALANFVGVGWKLLVKRGDAPYDRYAAAAELVAREAPPGAMLCTTDWDDFPWLYFYNTKSTYLVGLDPTYFHDRYREAYWQWVDISQGKVPRPSRLLATRFPCAYVLSDREHTAFLGEAAIDPGLEEVLADERMVLYRVRRDGPPPLYPTTLG